MIRPPDLPAMQWEAQAYRDTHRAASVRHRPFLPTPFNTLGLARKKGAATAIPHVPANRRHVRAASDGLVGHPDQGPRYAVHFGLIPEEPALRPATLKAPHRQRVSDCHKWKFAACRLVSSTSHNRQRETSLRRVGIMSGTYSSRKLAVARGPLDLLSDTLTFSLHPCRLLWMPLPLTAKWS